MSFSRAPKPDSRSACVSTVREETLAAVLDPSRLPTPPGVALQVIQAASRPDCRSSEIVSLLALDPALTAKVLKAVNSCLYGLARPVSSLQRAVTVLGLNSLRSLAIGLSLPAITHRSANSAMHDYWVSSVGGAILARELAVRIKHPAPEDDMVAALLRDLGEVLLQQSFPNDWNLIATRRNQCLPEDVSAIEREQFGIDHAEVTANVLSRWQLPEDLVAAIRHHHEPHKLENAPSLIQSRAWLLDFVEHLTRLDIVTQDPASLSKLLNHARERYQLPQPALIAFLEGISPKVSEFAQLLNLDVTRSPEFAQALVTASEVLAHFSLESHQRVVSYADPSPASKTPFGKTLDARVARPASPSLPDGIESDLGAEFIDLIRVCRQSGYELRAIRGRGGMGIVFKAYEPSLDRFVAVKVLNPELASNLTARKRFIREARIAAAIRHENVVSIYAVKEIADITYLAMEYVEGISLEESIESSEPPALPEILRLAGQMASGLAAAHARGIVHRDIKPANILVERESGLVKITDFGLARRSVDVSLSREGALVGTPLFMAPEQVNGQPVDARTDLFSLGGVLYALCTGSPPFPGATVSEILLQVCEQEPKPPRLVRPDIPNWLEDLILRLLRKKPDERLQSASEVTKLLASQQ